MKKIGIINYGTGNLENIKNVLDHLKVKFKEISSPNEIKNIGLFENYSSIITFVEWPEIIEKKPKKNTHLLFNYEDNFSKRSLTISSTYKKELIDEFK